MPMADKGKRSQRYPSKNRGINGNGSMQKGGGSTGKHKGGLGGGGSKKGY